MEQWPRDAPVSEGNPELTRSRPKRRSLSFRKGTANMFIDAFLHSHFSENVGVIFLDGLLHVAVEKNPKESFRKFVRFNVPALLREASAKGGVETYEWTLDEMQTGSSEKIDFLFILNYAFPCLKMPGGIEFGGIRVGSRFMEK